MKNILLIFLMFSFLQANDKSKSETEEIIKNFADKIIAGSTWRFINNDTKEIYETTDEIPENKNIDVRVEVRYNNWLYSNGILNIAMLELGETLKEQEYKDFTFKNIRFAFDNYKWFEANQTDMTYWVFPFGMLYTMDALDCCGSAGASLIEVCKYDKRDEYTDYIEKAADYIINEEHKLEDGTFARKSPAEMTVWADDLYMSLSFLSRYGAMKNDNEVFDFAAKQVKNFRKYLYNETTRLYHHGWYDDIKEHNVAHWGRANGWVMFAQVALLDALPEDHPARPELLEIFHEQVMGIASYQTESGLWRQLTNKTDSYLETSSSAMFTYSIARAVRKGYLDSRYKSIAVRGWEGLKTRLNEEGKLESICMGTSMRNDLVFYYTRPQKVDDIHALGVFILAGIEMMKLENE